MTAVELRTELNKEIEKIPIERLEEALNLVKQFTQSTEDDELDSHFEKVLKENKGLLERLAK